MVTVTLCTAKYVCIYSNCETCTAISLHNVVNFHCDKVFLVMHANMHLNQVSADIAALTYWFSIVTFLLMLATQLDV